MTKPLPAVFQWMKGCEEAGRGQAAFSAGSRAKRAAKRASPTAHAPWAHPHSGGACRRRTAAADGARHETRALPPRRTAHLGSLSAHHSCERKSVIVAREAGARARRRRARAAFWGSASERLSRDTRKGEVLVHCALAVRVSNRVKDARLAQARGATTPTRLNRSTTPSLQGCSASTTARRAATRRGQCPPRGASRSRVPNTHAVPAPAPAAPPPAAGDPPTALTGTISGGRFHAL